MDQEQKQWRDYDSIVASYRQLADIRFKLLALLPSVSSLAIGIISFDLKAFAAEPLPRFLIGILGFTITLGLVFYDKRNSQLYYKLAEKAEDLEVKEKIGATQFTERINHGSGLSLIYGSVLGAWLFPIFCGIFWGVQRVSDHCQWGSSLWFCWPKVPVRAAALAVIGAVLMVIMIYYFNEIEARLKILIKKQMQRSG